MNHRREFFLTLAASLVAARGTANAQAKPPLAQKDAPKINLDGWQVTCSEVNYAPGQASGRHRHPGFVVGYVLQGQYKFAVNDQPATVLNTGQMFFESFDEPNQSHTTSGNASATEPAKILAIVFTKKGDPVTIPGH